MEDHNFATSIAVALRSAMSAGNILALRAKIVIFAAMSIGNAKAIPNRVHLYTIHR